MNLQPRISASARIFTRQQDSKPIQNTKGKNPTGRNVGKLMRIMNVPVDVFLEITSHLRPIDVLQLARVSKELRDMLMSRNTRSIWVAARKNFNPPLPDCPANLSEPQYASLVFETKCMACGAARATWKVNYAARVRLCGPCWKANIRSGTVLSKEAGIKEDAALMAVIFNMLPDASGTNSFSNHTELHQTMIKTKFYEAEFIAVVRKYEEIRAKEDVEALKDYISKCGAMTLERLNFQIAMQIWERKQSQVKRQDDRDVSASRKAAIIERLQQLGYQKSDLTCYDTEFYNIITQPRPLTERIWKTIRPKLIRILEPNRARREKEAFKQKWPKRMQELSAHYRKFLSADRKQHPYKRTLPNALDALELPCMQSLIMSAEPEDAVAEAAFTAIEADLRRESESIYRAQVLSDLVQYLQVQTGPRKGSTSASHPKAIAKSQSKSKKGKGKKCAMDSASSAENPDDETEAASAQEPQSGPALTTADRKVLNDLTTLFSCRWFCSKYMTCTQAMEHWQLRHPNEPWSPTNMEVLGEHEERRGLVLPVLKALGLPETCGVADFDAVVEPGVLGSLQCSCGHLATDIHLTMKYLSDHCSATYIVGQVPEHRITFVPLDATETTPAATSSATEV